MASVSIQGRVDSEIWAELKRQDETNTKLLQRLISHYQATSGDQLDTIAATPQGAIAVLLHSHGQMEQLIKSAALTLPSTTSAAPAAPSEPNTPTCFDDDW